MSKNGKTLLLEIEGGTFTQGRHSRGVGFHNDTLKYNALQLNGFVLVRFTAIQINTHLVDTVELINSYFDNDINFNAKLNEFTTKYKYKPKRRKL